MKIKVPDYLNQSFEFEKSCDFLKHPYDNTRVFFQIPFSGTNNEGGDTVSRLYPNGKVRKQTIKQWNF